MLGNRAHGARDQNYFAGEVNLDHGVLLRFPLT
jgi:hypothetical protein